jgi:hypothetical protein
MVPPGSCHAEKVVPEPAINIYYGPNFGIDGFWADSACTRLIFGPGTPCNEAELNVSAVYG